MSGHFTVGIFSTGENEVMRRRNMLGSLVVAPLAAVLGIKAIRQAKDEPIAKPVMYGRKFEGVDFAGHPPEIFVNCKFQGCGGLIVADDAHPNESEFYNCEFSGDPLRGYKWHVTTGGPRMKPRMK